jgi:hypothetical protein
MSTKSDKPKTKTTDKKEQDFYRFARALIAVPKKEIDEQEKLSKQKPPKRQAAT